MTRYLQRTALLTWWLAWALLVVVLRLLSSGIPESGDGVMHHLIARYAWQEPRLFLDHWGKPLFTLLSSPFAQFGVWGMALFNAVCFVATCWAADRVLKERSALGRWLFAPLLLCMPVYGSMVFAGLTEVLFGLLALLAVVALFGERYVQGMLIASLLPFARPEYVAVWPFLIAWVLWMGQWKALPWILTAHVVYAIAGTFGFGDPFWVITQDPYSWTTSVYGRGPLLHFTDRIQHIYGAPFMWALAVAIVLALMQAAWERTRRRTVGFLAFCALLPAFSIIVVHSVLWWKGWKGSLGLTRVLATGAPLGALFVCAMLVVPEKNRVARGWFRTAVVSVAGVAYVIWAMWAFLAEQQVPLHDSAVERVAREAGEAVAALKEDQRRVGDAPPLVVLFAGIDPFDTESVTTRSQLRPNDLLVWDAAYGPNERGMVLDTLLQDPGLDLVKVIVPEERWIVFGGNPMEYFLFVRRPRTQKVDHRSIYRNGHWNIDTKEIRCDSVPCEPAMNGALCLGAGEFPLEVRDLTWDMQDLLYSELTFSGSTNERFRIVVELDRSTGTDSYWAQDVEAGEFKVRFHIPPHDLGDTKKAYFIDLDRRVIQLSNFEVSVDHTRDTGSE